MSAELCPDCGGSGFADNWDGTSSGGCLTCGGWGSTPLSTAEQLDAQEPGTVVLDVHGDTVTKGADGLWHQPETIPLGSQYMAKHYAPFVVIKDGGEA